MQTETIKTYGATIVLLHKKQQYIQITSRLKTALKTLVCLQLFRTDSVPKQKEIISVYFNRRRVIRSEIKELLNSRV